MTTFEAITLMLASGIFLIELIRLVILLIQIITKK